MQTDIVKLTDLKPGHDYPGGNINSRKTYTREQLASRKESIAAFGILQSLLVCPAPGNSGPPFFVVAGGLRLLAIEELAREKRIAADFAVPVLVKPDWDSATALSASIEENRSPVPPHPVEVYEQFAELIKRGKTVEQLQSLYGMTRKQTEGVLRLGTLHPEIRKAWHQGTIHAETAQDFTLETDQKRQLSVFEKCSKGSGWWQARQLLIGSDSEDSSKYINFIGIEAYEAAGGKVLIDLFKDRHGCSDPALAMRLADEKLEQEINRLIAGGWAWAKPDTDLPHMWRYGWNKIEAKPKHTKEEKERLAEIDARTKSINESDERDDLDDDGYEEGERLDAERASIVEAAKSRAFTSEQKAKSGVVLQLNQQGALECTYGVIKPADLAKVADRDLSEAGKKKKAVAPSPDSISQALNQRLSETLTYAAGDALRKQPSLALRAVIAGISAHAGGTVCIEERGLAAKKRKMSSLLFSWKTTTFASVFAGLNGKKDSALLAALAEIAGDSLDFQCLNGQKPLADKDVAILCDVIDAKALNAAIRAKFDAKDYFGSIKKSVALIAIQEACGDDAARKLSSKPTKDVLKAALANVPKTGWLPPELRTAHYDGPGAKKPAAKPKPKSTRRAA